MRLMLAVVLVGCASSPKPAVLRMMTSMPDDPQKANDLNESVQARPRADSDIRKPLPGKLAHVETAAATAAALVGEWFSSSKSVLIGVGGDVDEMLLVDPDYAKSIVPVTDPPPEAPPYDPNTLVPWVRF